jgi:hypothetical protein
MSSDGIHTTTKKELVRAHRRTDGQTKVVVKEILQSFLDEIVRELAAGATASSSASSACSSQGAQGAPGQNRARSRRSRSRPSGS